MASLSHSRSASVQSVPILSNSPPSWADGQRTCSLFRNCGATSIYLLHPQTLRQARLNFAFPDTRRKIALQTRPIPPWMVRLLKDPGSAFSSPPAPVQHITCSDPVESPPPLRNGREQPSSALLKETHTSTSPLQVPAIFTSFGIMFVAPFPMMLPKESTVGCFGLALRLITCCNAIMI